MRRYLAFLWLVCFCPLSIGDPGAAPPPQSASGCIDWSNGACSRYWVSIIQLIGSPEKFNGKRVLTQGYIHIDEHEREGKSLYVHKEDYLNDLTKNGLWVTFAAGATLERCQDAYVSVVGTFSSDTGHMGGYGGSINIESCAAMRPNNRWRGP
jgi:hypothetical protein